MKKRAGLGAALLLAALGASGCWLQSRQLTVALSLPTPLRLDASQTIEGARIDLATQRGYNDHKGSIEGIADCAILGQFSNPNAPDPSAGPVEVVVYMTPDYTDYTLAGEVTADPNKVLVWGPLALAVGQSRRVGWDESAALVRPAGKAALLREAKGDGRFSLYAVGSSGGYRFRVDQGALVLVLDAAK